MISLSKLYIISCVLICAIAFRVRKNQKIETWIYQAGAHKPVVKEMMEIKFDKGREQILPLDKTWDEVKASLADSEWFLKKWFELNQHNTYPGEDQETASDYCKKLEQQEAGSEKYDARFTAKMKIPKIRAAEAVIKRLVTAYDIEDNEVLVPTILKIDVAKPEPTKIQITVRGADNPPRELPAEVQIKPVTVYTLEARDGPPVLTVKADLELEIDWVGLANGYTWASKALKPALEWAIHDNALKQINWQTQVFQKALRVSPPSAAKAKEELSESQAEERSQRSEGPLVDRPEQTPDVLGTKQEENGARSSESTESPKRLEAASSKSTEDHSRKDPNDPIDLWTEGIAAQVVSPSEGSHDQRAGSKSEKQGIEEKRSHVRSSSEVPISQAPQMGSVATRRTCCCRPRRMLKSCRLFGGVKAKLAQQNNEKVCCIMGVDSQTCGRYKWDNWRFIEECGPGEVIESSQNPVSQQTA